ncbi:MAG: poly(A) polymerase [Planctomycetota bacterium]|jgi:poly(A) polymerase
MPPQAEWNLDALDQRQVRAARFIARTLRDVGFEAWLVGGCVRDLYMGNTPHDLDLATDATPDDIEGLFKSTIGVGRAFGTMIVIHREAGELIGSEQRGESQLEQLKGAFSKPELPGIDSLEATTLMNDVGIEVTSYRSDGEYTDSRRPDDVTYVSSAEIDASRRDFTCNAIYLDPLDNRIFDPAHGCDDIDARVLRCVGNPKQRFEEDGLRLMRMARFQARFDFNAEAGLHDTAREERESLRGVSIERVVAELEKIFNGPRSARAIEILMDCRLFEVCLPAEWSRLSSPTDGERVALISAFPKAPGLVLGLAALFGGDPESADRAAPLALLAQFKLARATLRSIQGIWAGERELFDLLKGSEQRARRIRLVRDVEWPLISELHRARLQSNSQDPSDLDELIDWSAALTATQLHPAPLLEAKDLAKTEAPRGPLWGQLLRDLEDGQLSGTLSDRSGALAWLRKRVAELR